MPEREDKVKAVLKDEASKEIVHQHFAATCFNACWTYIDKDKRSSDDIEDMLTSAQASLWHWKKRTDCTPQNLSIAYWQLAKVHFLAGDTFLTKFYADKCIAITTSNKLSPFSHGYSYEVGAYAAAMAADKNKATEYIALAQAQVPLITDAEEQKMLVADIEKVQVFIAN